MGIIAGIIKRSESKEKIRQKLSDMIKIQAHRDPSGTSFVLNSDHLAVGCVNHFDMKEDNAREKTHVTPFVDGVVLNIPDLKKEFDQIGNVNEEIKSSSILAASYLRWGLDFMNHLEGEFACAVWDDKEKQLVLARDPYGHKPLHYYHNDHELIFSSEIKGIIEAGIAAEIDLVNFSDFLTLNNIPYPGTIFKNIFQVPPGSILIFKNNSIRIKTYWHHEIKDDLSISFNDALMSTENALKRAVEKRMIGKHTYCFLSGGIDSSAVVSYAAEAASNKIHAISIGFDEEEKNEIEEAEAMAKHVGAEFHPFIVRPDSFFDMLEKLVWHHDIPFTDTSAYPSFFAGKVGAELTDIILTGDGPDQAMGGSSHYVFAVQNNIFEQRSVSKTISAKAISRFLDKVTSSPTPSLITKAQRKFYRDSLSPIQAAYDLRSYFPDVVKKYLCNNHLWQVHCDKSPYRHPEKWFHEVESNDNINKYLYADMSFYVPDDLMIKVDRMCMAHGLETLSPFQDIHLSAIVNRLPGSYKISQQHRKIVTKHILKEICKDRFPSEIINKKKQGFGIPLEKWLRQNKGEGVKEILLDPKTLNRPYFKNQALEKMVNTFVDGKGDYFFPSSNSIAGLLIFEIWHRKYID